MDVSFVAFVLGVINFALLGLLAVSWRRERTVRRELGSIREAEIMSQLDRLGSAMRERRDQLKALKEQVEALKISQDVFEHHTRGWQEGYAETARDMHRKLDERLTKLEVRGE